MTAATSLETASLVVRGLRSELRLEDGEIVIAKQATTQPEPTEVRFDVERVRSVSLHRPPRGGRGWVHVAVVGGSPAPPSELAASSDPYTLPITSRAVGGARRLARLVDEHVRSRGLPSELPTPETHSSGVSVVAPAEAAQPAAPASAARHLASLAELRAAGVLTREEHDRAARRVRGG